MQNKTFKQNCWTFLILSKRKKAQFQGNVSGHCVQISPTLLFVCRRNSFWINLVTCITLKDAFLYFFYVFSLSFFCFFSQRRFVGGNRKRARKSEERFGFFTFEASVWRPPNIFHSLLLKFFMNFLYFVLDLVKLFFFFLFSVGWILPFFLVLVQILDIFLLPISSLWTEKNYKSEPNDRLKILFL